MSLLSRLGIRLDSHTLGNLVKNLSPAAGLLGGPAGLLAAGGASALGDALRGKTPSLSNAVTNAGLGAGLNSGVGYLKSLGQAGESAAGAAASAAPEAGGERALMHPSPFPSVTPPVTPPAAPPPSALSRLGSFIEKNPAADAAGLQGLGKIATAPAENEASRAQARLLGTQADAADYALQTKKRGDAASEALRQQLAQILGQTIGQPGYGQLSAGG